jgi:hypothetical protein
MASSATAVFERKLLSCFSSQFESPELLSTTATNKYYGIVDESYALMSIVDEVVFLIAGKDLYDEIILSEILDTIDSVVRHLADGKVNELTFLETENFGKFCVALDEVILNVSSRLYYDNI